jgi:uncharacterized protein (TIGR02246 family)
LKIALATTLATALATTLATLSLNLALVSPAQAEAQAGAQAHDADAMQYHRHHGHRDRVEIERVLKRYEQGLNTGDAGAVAKLYTEDAVLLAPENPSAVGIQAIEQSYVGTFQAIRLNIAFQVAEVQTLSSEWALLRTNSTGLITITANGATIPEGNQELFLMQKVQGQWKIARYSFSTSLPAAR